MDTGLFCANGVYHGSVEKYKIVGSSLYMATGTWQLFDKALECMHEGKPKDWPSIDGSTITVVVFEIIDNELALSVCMGGYQGEMPINSIMAWGSGREIAVGAMGAGTSATKACEIACEYESNCHEPIVTLRPNFDEFKWVVGDER